MADNTNEEVSTPEVGTKPKSSFVRGLKDEFLGMACRDGVEAFNIENLIFGTIGHVGVGVLAASAVMAIGKLKGPKIITTKVFSGLKKSA